VRVNSARPARPGPARRLHRRPGHPQIGQRAERGSRRHHADDGDGGLERAVSEPSDAALALGHAHVYDARRTAAELERACGADAAHVRCLATGRRRRVRTHFSLPTALEASITRPDGSVLRMKKPVAVSLRKPQAPVDVDGFVGAASAPASARVTAKNPIASAADSRSKQSLPNRGGFQAPPPSASAR
jgi:hypothetical protein